ASTILTVSAPAVVRRLRTRQRPARPGHPVTCGTSCVPTIGDTGYWMPAGAYHRAALRADPLAGMTAETSQRILAACPARALHQHSPSKKPEGAGKTGWPLHPGPLAPEKLREGRVTTGTGGYTPAFPAQWFTAYFGLSPVNQLVCHRRRPRCVEHRGRLGACMGAPGPHDFAVRERCRSSCAIVASTASRSPRP